MKIRFAKTEDIDEIIRLCKEHADFEESDFSSSNEKKEALKQAIFSKEPSLFCLIVEVDGRIAGYSTYMRQFSTWDGGHYIYMDCLYLEEHARGFGIGEKIIEKIKEESVKLGCNLIQWQTPSFNKRAINFYHRIGAHSKTKERFFLEI